MQLFPILFQWFSQVLYFQTHVLSELKHEQFRCEEVGVRGYPTIKYGDPDDLQVGNPKGFDGLKKGKNSGDLHIKFWTKRFINRRFGMI